MRTRGMVSLSVIVAAIAAGAVVTYQHVGGADAKAPRYRTQAVTRERIVATVTASGTLSPLKTVEVGSQVSGRVLELDADFNSRVKRGDVIARIDPRLFASEVTRAKANLTAARANLTKARSAVAEARKQNDRTQALAGEKLVARADADTAGAKVEAAAAERVAAAAAVTQAEAALEQAETNLALTTILSPIDGVVISRDVDVGQTVAASLSAPRLFTIAEDMRAMEVHTSVAESDVGALAEGMAVHFTVDAFPGETFDGAVSQIRNAPTTVQNVVTYDAVVRVDNAAGKLRPGMTANVTFVVRERDGVLAVPAAALRFTPDAAAEPPRGKVVWVLEGGEPRAVPVTTGATDGRLVEVVKGDLAEGALVITGQAGAAAPSGRPTRGGGGQGQRGGGRAPGMGF